MNKEETHKYTMAVSLNILHELGINLYSNVPAVLSEAVANAWDADAKKVEVVITEDKITITDDGHGMSEEDINSKYLTVGYRRREEQGGELTHEFERPVMGRKGIGKLSLFSIADAVQVESIKDGVKNGLIMSGSKIEDFLVNRKSRYDEYHPDDVDIDEITIDQDKGTRIILTDLKKEIHQAGDALRTRISRRFCIIGDEFNFNVIINGTPVTISDRKYFHKLQHLWYYGDDNYSEHCKEDKIDKIENRENLIGGTIYQVTGWIGSVENSGDLQEGDDNLNKIIIMVRGKLAQEDILEDYAEGGLYSNYLMGEIHADFLDVDSERDITTTSRQEIIKDDERYKILSKWVNSELKHIQAQWTSLRTKKGTEEALKNTAIEEWFNGLKPDYKKRAQSLFGKINRLTLTKTEKSELFQHSVLAFENLKYKGNLDALEQISPENLEEFSKILSEIDDIEATLYHQIVTPRLKIIKKLQDYTTDDALEIVVQQHLYDHLWLLDPSWERTTETPLMEQQVKTAFEEIDAGLTDEEEKGRFDIKYKTTSKKHIIIELKRSGVLVSTAEILGQVDKYRNALMKLLKAAGNDNEPVEIVCIVGRDLKDWTDPTKEKESREMLKIKDIRVIHYEELIDDAYNNYKAFLEKNKEAGRLVKLIQDIKADDDI